MPVLAGRLKAEGPSRRRAKFQDCHPDVWPTPVPSQCSLSRPASGWRDDEALDSPAAVRVRPPKRRAKVWRIRMARVASRISWMRRLLAAITSLRVRMPTIRVGLLRGTTINRPTFSVTIRSAASRRV